MSDEFACPACGAPQAEAPWREGHGSLEICSSCGIQFGYTDMAGGDKQRRKDLWIAWRRAWLANGRRSLTQQEEQEVLDQFYGGRASES